MSVNKKKQQNVDVENIPRTSFTPGWSRSISEVDALPVKRNGKVVRVTRVQDEEAASESDHEEEEKVEKKKNAKRRKTEEPKAPLTDEELAERQRAIKKAHVHRKAKNERKKRKQNQDEVELGLLESNAQADVNSKKRFQADCLHEICLIYFRIVKGKVGFTLLPSALEGLSRITHLINIDTVQDLMTLLKGILEQVIPAPVTIQLQCVHCALRTLSGPGAELNLDGDIYLHKLRTLIRDLPAGFTAWDSVLECMDLCFLKKREERANIVLSFSRLLLMSAVHLSSTVGPTVYAMAHAILMRYPRVRQDMLMVQHPMAVRLKFGAPRALESLPLTGKAAKKVAVLFTEDEVVEDLAMKTLREESVGESNMDHVNWDFKEDKLGDGSWILPLQRLHVDPRYENITYTLSNRELLPMPMRISDAVVDAAEIITQRLTYSLQVLPATLGNNKHSNKSKEDGENVSGARGFQHNKPQNASGGRFDKPKKPFFKKNAKK
eukprot:gene12061-13979_t